MLQEISGVSANHADHAYDAPYLFIDGERIYAADRQSRPVIDPATEAVIGHLPLATTEDLDRAIAASERAFKVWRDMSAFDRAQIMRKAAEILRGRSNEIAIQMTLEQGKTLGEARSEVSGTADFLDWDGDEGRRIYGRIVPSRVPHQRQMVFKVPIGPVVTMTPWNYPFLIPVRKISSVLAAGCSCIIKPAEETPNSALVIAEAFEEAGLPRGVLQVVFGDPATVSTHLLSSPVIRGCAFTGSTEVGGQLASLASKSIKRCVMELGGHAPVLVFADADPEKVAEMARARKFRNAGQGCLSPTRFFIHESIYDRFAARIGELVGAMQVGPGFEPESEMGALTHERRVPFLESLIRDAQEAGGELLCGGQRLDRKGYFLTPTVLANVPDHARIMQEEPFGPIITLSRFSTFDEAIEKANNTAYGLAAYCFTTDNATAIAAGDKLEAGLIGMNSFAVGSPTSFASPEVPFGGMKLSGYGSEGGIEGLEAYLDIKFISQF